MDNEAPAASQNLATESNKATPTAAEPGTQSSVMRSASIVSGAIMMSRITGLVRESLLSGLFGAGQQFDAFTLAFRIPNLTRDLFAEGALSSAFVPVFTEYLTQRSRQEAARLVNLVGTALIVFVGLFCLVGILAAPAFVSALAHGFTDNPAKFDLAVTMTRIMFPFLLLVALAAQAMGVLNACNQFAVPALSSSLFNIGSVVFGLLMGYVVGPYLGITHIVGMAYGVVFGGAAQLLVQIPSLRASGFKFHLAWDLAHPGLRRIFAMMGPAILGNAAVQVNVMINSNFASAIVDPVRGQDGPMAWLAYAFRFMQLPLGLFGVAIASATLPAISRSASAQNFMELRATMARSLGVVFLLTVPSSVGLAVLGRSMIGLVYEHGAFTQYDTDQTAFALACYTLGLAGYSAVKVLNPAFYALNEANTPMVVSLLSIIINFATAYTVTTYTGFGHAGLALSTSSVALFSFVALFLRLRTRIGGVEGRRLLSTGLKVSAASAVMGVVVWLVSNAINAHLGTSKTARSLDLGVCIPLGLIVFYSVARLLKTEELDIATTAIARPLARRIPALRTKLK